MKRRVVGIALFCLVLLAAIFAGYWDMLSTETTRLAREEAAEAEKNETRALADAAAPAAPAPASSEPASAAAPAKTAALPSFDVLRVEPDGSTVMAGKAPAGTTVRLTDGRTTLGEETSGPGGDFAIVLDKPLPVGEHQIRIEATSPDGTASISRETAIVSVPERGRESELLAMVETPDQPSRLISVPKGETTAGPSVQVQGQGATREGSAPTQSGAVNSEATAETSKASDAGPASTPASSDPDESQAPDAAAVASASEPQATRPGEPARSNLVTPSALAVEAVEIEDDTIYVAGRAPAGPTIRVYVDNVFLAEDAGRKTDRFLVSTKAPVIVGQHMVRADQVAPDGSVLARVEVPFLKPEGRRMSAVASADAPAADTSGGQAPAGAEPSQGETSSGPSTETASMPAEPGTGSEEEAASAALDPASPAKTTDAATPPASVSPSGADALDDAGPDVAAARQEPLKATGARVIIRRGDTLWRISREAYGRGARYTTIYLANGDQIRDPDRIYPGQVFRMPETRAE